MQGSTLNILNSNTTVKGNQLIENIQWTSYNSAHTFNGSADKRFQSGIAFGGQVFYRISPSRKLFASFQFQESRTDLQKNYSISTRPKINETFLFYCGISFELK